MSWDMRFINPPTIEEIKNNQNLIIEEHNNNNNNNNNNRILSFKYYDEETNEEKISDFSFMTNTNENGEEYLFYAITPYGSYVLPIFQELYDKYNTIVVDDDYDYFYMDNIDTIPEDIENKITEEEYHILSEVELAYYLANKYGSDKNNMLYHKTYVENIQKVLSYFDILKKYNLLFTTRNIFYNEYFAENNNIQEENNKDNNINDQKQNKYTIYDESSTIEDNININNIEHDELPF